MLNYNNKAVKDEIKRNKIDFLDNEEKDQVLNNRLSCEPDVENMVGDKTIEERMMIILSSLIEDEQYLYFAHYHEKCFSIN